MQSLDPAGALLVRGERRVPPRRAGERGLELGGMPVRMLLGQDGRRAGCDPADVEPAVRLAAKVSGKPAVAYPNSGEARDANARAWTGAATRSPTTRRGGRRPARD